MSDERGSSARLRVVRPAASTPPGAPNAPGAAPEEPTEFDALYRRHARYVAAIAMRLLGRDDEVDDLVQDVFLEAFRGLDRLREPAAVKGWLATVTVRLAVRRLRKRRLLHVLRLELERELPPVLASSATPEQRALVARIYRALDKLPARTRVIWSLRHVLEQPLQAIVELTGASQSTVQRKLRDAERLLEQELHDE